MASVPARGKPAHASHPVALSGLRATMASAPSGPMLVERRDQNFIEGLMADLGADQAYASLQAQAPDNGDDGGLRLYPPIQRVFNLAVVEAYCDTPGKPRLDPAKIASAGMVLRRVDAGGNSAWVKAGSQIFGWESIDEDVDPEADKRPPAVSLGSSALERRVFANQLRQRAGAKTIAMPDVAVTEQVLPLFVAPPDVCAKAGRTVLFGVVSVSSSEQAEAPADIAGYGATDEGLAAIAGDLSLYLKASASARTLPMAGQTITSDQVRNAGSLSTLDSPAPSFNLLVRQLRVELDAFGDGSADLLRALNRIQVETDGAAPAPAGDFLAQASAVLMDAEPGTSFVMPQRWGTVGDDVAADILNAICARLDTQFGKLQIGRGRFDKASNSADPQYVLRCFIRLKPEQAGCPPRLVWTDSYSLPFTIAPWFESSGAAPPLIPMPDLFDAGQLKKLKPNVAFSLPPKLAALLKGDPNDLIKGSGSGGDGLGLGWICSFSLPIITLCAFIVLNIFLGLFNLIFFWMPFLKICIPIPVPKKNS